eukprot:CAMPEP_0181231576 /NCGR_PEP_ID=MMETSP1096-20121128/35192_1 /TAXON_ID=156174 ORGANISM="Chrysochromulina ericina, Strain CCMP281" /NCGR_SAMPLE_ID=MMETSP1096 /ASSEMBLY_ACC=CAM_ASM_000453 /LENGTH=50 /DNA_ID=CAMNT_0023325651 /DNA_START=286 /DNA_END=435 /DNA_ORIENTATION=-
MWMMEAERCVGPILRAAGAAGLCCPIVRRNDDALDFGAAGRVHRIVYGDR